MEDDQRREFLERLYTEHASAVHGYARRRTTPTAAEDVVMEVFVIACRRLDDVPRVALPWLLACARRVIANQRRGVQRAEALTERLMSAARVVGVGDETAEVVGVALSELRDGDREILLLSAWDDLDLSEIAAVLGCSRTAAAVRLHRARRRLGVALETARRGSRQPRNAEVTS